MPALIEQLAALTGLRDRDAVDVGLVAVLSDLAGVRRIALHRLVGDADERRWLTCVERHVETDGQAGSVPIWTAQEAAQPRLDDHPDWRDCLEARRPRPWNAKDRVTLFPLLVDSGSGGVIELESLKPLSAAVHRGLAVLLQVVSNQLGLLDYSQRDTLTGLLNRKSFDEAFFKAATPKTALPAAGQVERRHAGGSRYWLAVMDIDHFKLVNDGFGHLIGDEVLLLRSQLMGNSFRFYDQLYRFGGEEFVVLLRCNTEQEAMGALERFRLRVANHLFPQVKHVTVSVGFTDVRDGDTPNAAVERADKAVYYAKHHGRNQVHSMEALIRDGLMAAASKAEDDVELF
jgi:diguanylate cyclase (GGDEF)-like protein